MKLAALFGALMVLAIGVRVGPVEAATGTLRVDPGTLEAPGGTEFTVKIIQNADVGTAGSQVSLRFDIGIVEVVSVEAGAVYASGQLLLQGTPEEAAAEANQTGLLRCVATFLPPGGGSVPAGDAEFLIIKMRAKGGGTSPLSLVGEGCGGASSKIEMVDAEYTSITDITATDGSVTVTGAAPPVPGVTPPPGSPTPAGTPTTAIGVIGTALPKTPTAGGTPSGTVLSSGVIPGAGRPRFTLVPQVAGAGKGEPFTIEVKASSDKPVSLAAVQFKFRKELVQVESIEAGPNWASATGASANALTAVVANANESGSVETNFSLNSNPAPPGEATLMTVNLLGGQRDGKSAVEFVSVSLSDAEGNPIEVTFEDGEILIGSGGGGGGGFTTILLFALLLLILGATFGGSYYMIQRRKRQWAGG
jgi:hypothetical protein